MNDSYGMYNLWLRYVEKLSVETLLDCYIHSFKSSDSYDLDDDDDDDDDPVDVDLATGHHRFTLWFMGMVYTFHGPEWARMLSAQEDRQISRHIDPAVLADFERLVNL